MGSFWPSHSPASFSSSDDYEEGEIGGLTTGDPPTQPEVQALHDAWEELADDVRALSTLVHALGAALIAMGVVKGGVQSSTQS